MSRKRCALLLCFLSGCGRYRDFTLPPPEGHPEQVVWRWRVLPRPVLEPSEPWESSDVLNPSVILFRGRWLNLYSGFDGKTWSTGLAISSDGVSLNEWQKQGRVLAPDQETWEGNYMAANGSAVSDGQFIRYYYQAGSPFRIGLAQSSNGKIWTKYGKPILEPGPYGSWDERGLADPYVVRFGTQLYLFYTGIDRARRQRLGVAESADGVVWYKHRANPVLEVGDYLAFDERGLGEPAVWTERGYYWMLYTGRDRSENRRLGMARSRDGVNWEKQPPVIAGDQPWDSKVICDPSVMPSSNGIHVWFGGGDIARPDELIHGRIGFGGLSARPIE